MKKLLSVLLAVCMLACLLPFAASAAQPHYLVLGDSIAFGSGLANPREAVYGRIVADTEGYEYENYAVPGHTTRNLLSRMETPAVRDAIAKADIINISIGGNNFLLGNLNGLLYDGIVKQDYTRIDEIADGFYADLGEIMAKIRALNADAAVLIQTIYNPQTGYVGEVYLAGAVRMNAKIRQFAADHPGEILIVDAAAYLTDSAADFAEDRIHPSAAGNEKIAAAVVKTLAENGLGQDTALVINTPGVDARGTGMFTVFVNLYGRLFHVLAVIRSVIRGLGR